MLMGNGPVTAVSGDYLPVENFQGNSLEIATRSSDLPNGMRDSEDQAALPDE
jgi:hypothetical protein